MPVDRIVIGFFRPDVDYTPFLKDSNSEKPFDFSNKLVHLMMKGNL